MKMKLQYDSIYVASEPIDFRYGINTLSAYVADQFDLDPASKSLFIFTNHRKDRIKCLLYDGTGFWMLYRILNSGRFNWTMNESGAVSITAQQLKWLLSGLSIDNGTVFREYTPLYV